MYFVYFSKEKRFANSDWLAGDVSVFSAFVKKKERAHVKKNDFIVLVKGWVEYSMLLLLLTASYPLVLF